MAPMLWSWQSKPKRWLNNAPGAATLIIAVRTEWRTRSEAGFYEQIPALEAVERFAAYCFESIVPSVHGIRKVRTPMLWELMLTGIGDSHTIPIDELNEIGTELAKRTADFTRRPATRLSKS